MPSARHRRRNPTRPQSEAVLTAIRQPSDLTRARDEIFVDNVAGAEGWSSVVVHICDYLGLPDVNTPRGLREVQANFRGLYNALDTLYTRYHDIDRVVGGIAGIYAKFCENPSLINLLLKEDFLSKIFPLLDRPICRYVALQAISSIAHHGDPTVRFQIVFKSSTIIRLMREHPSDARLTDLGVVALVHAAAPFCMPELMFNLNPLVKQRVNIPELLKAFMENMKKPTASVLVMEHVHDFLRNASQTMPQEFNQVPSSVNWLLACLRCKNPVNRIEAIHGVRRLYFEGAEMERPSYKCHFNNLGGFRTKLWPEPTIRALGSYEHSSDSDTLLGAHELYSDARTKFSKDQQLYPFGVTLAHVFLMADFPFEEEHLPPRSGRIEGPVLDSLPVLARILREKSNDTMHSDMADVLHLKWLMAQSQTKEAHSFARRALKRNPHQVYFYFVLAQGTNRVECLRMAKKGLWYCDESRTTKYLKFGLRYLAAQHARNLGFNTITGTEYRGTNIYDETEDDENRRWGEGFAFLTSAFEDFKVLIIEAAPDSVNMRPALYWYTFLLFALRGAELTDDLTELLEIKNRLSAVDKLCNPLGGPPAKSSSRLACLLIFERLANASKQWSSAVSHFDSITLSDQHRDPGTAFPSERDQTEDYLAVLLENVNLDDSHPGIVYQPTAPAVNQPKNTLVCGDLNPKVTLPALDPYQCSCCGNVSSELTKCGKCDLARYCDAACRDAHFTVHKVTCGLVAPVEHHSESEKSGNQVLELPTTTNSLMADKFTVSPNDDEGWNAVVHRLCEFLKLPDLSTRRGLRQVNKDFNKINGALDRLYAQHKDDDRVAGAIVGIYAKMCVDAVLRNRLFDEGVMSKMYALLDRPFCQLIALQAISTVTHHGGIIIRASIAKKASLFIRLMREQPSDPRLAELCIAILTHAALAVVGNEKPPIKEEKEQAKISELLRLFVEYIKKPSSTLLLLNHAHEFLCTATQHCAEEFKNFPPSISYLVASTLSKSPLNRVDAVLGIFRLYYFGSEKNKTSFDVMSLMRRFIQLDGRFPDHITDALGEHKGSSDTGLMLSTTRKYHDAMMQVVQDRDLYALGVKLSDMILSTEYSIADGSFEATSLSAGRPPGATLGLPFVRFTEALPHCARALREKSTDAQHADMADVVQLKSLMVQSRMREAHEIARRSIERNPTQGFFYYVLTNGAKSRVEGLKIAKKGLRRGSSKDMSGYVKFGLTYYAAEHAAQMGLERISGTDATSATKRDEVDESRRWGEGLAFLTSAYEDLKVFVNEASPDTKNMRNALYWYALVLFALKGHELGEDMTEAFDITKKLHSVDTICTFFSNPPAKTQLRLTCLTILDGITRARQDWSKLVARFDALIESEPSSALSKRNRGQDDLEAWLGQLLDDEDGTGGSRGNASNDYPKMVPFCHTNPKITPNLVELYRCSFCGSPSASLKKCSRCGFVRYCDGTCQKAHWLEHKPSCRPR